MVFSEVAPQPFRVGAKGRFVLPVAVRRAAHIDEGAEVVAHADGEGRVVIETLDSIRKRVWAAAPSARRDDITADVRAMRNEDNELADESFRRRTSAVASKEEREAAGAALLAHLGL